MQVVPDGMSCRVVHEPLAHCWYWVPPTQLKIPSLVQEPERVLPPVVDVLLVPAVDTGVAETDEAVVDEVVAVTSAVLAAEAVDTVAKTPPALADVVAVLAEVVVAFVVADSTVATEEAEVADVAEEADVDESEPDSLLLLEAPRGKQSVPEGLW